MVLSRRHINSVGLVVKASNPQAVEESAKVSAWLKQRGIPVFVLEHAEKDAEFIVPDVDLVMAFGGDGTIVSTARHMLGCNIPLVGVNFGRVGFLAELSSATWQEALSIALEKGFLVEARMTLAYTLKRNGKIIVQGEAINDVVVTRGKLARLVQLNLSVDHVPFSTLRSDGIIISTPTGSTGYAGSAGGPVVMPCINAYVVAAICPFLGSFPPLMIGAESIVSVTVGESGADLYLSVDGQKAHELYPKDVLEAYGGRNPFLLGLMGMNSYFKRLQGVGIIHQAGA